MNTTSTFDAWLSEKEALVQKVKSEMGEHRFTHTLAVAKESIILATAFDFSEQDAKRLFIASLLHDYTKAYSTERQIALAKEYNIPLSKDDLASPPAYVCRLFRRCHGYEAPLSSCRGSEYTISYQDLKDSNVPCQGKVQSTLFLP